MTLGDVLALVAGVAIAFVVASGLRDLAGVHSPSVQLVLFVVRVVEGVMLALSGVVLTRVTIYHRIPTAAEWWSLLIGATLLADWSSLRVDAWIDVGRWAVPTLDPLSASGLKWLVAGSFSAVIAVGMGCLHLGRRALPAWLKTILLAVLALLAIAGPLGIFDQLGADLLSPLGGFGPGTLSILHRKLCEWTAGLPLGLLFGIPAVAALLERVTGRKWTWVEWAAFGGSSLALFVSMVRYRGEFSTPSPGWLAERLIVLGWFIVILLTSRLIVVRVGHHWQHWIEPSKNPDQSRPDSNSEANTRST